MYLKWRLANLARNAIACTAANTSWKKAILNQIVTKRVDLDQAPPLEDNASWCILWRARVALAAPTCQGSTGLDSHDVNGIFDSDPDEPPELEFAHVDTDGSDQLPTPQDEHDEAQPHFKKIRLDVPCDDAQRRTENTVTCDRLSR